MKKIGRLHKRALLVWYDVLFYAADRPNELQKNITRFSFFVYFTHRRTSFAMTTRAVFSAMMYTNIHQQKELKFECVVVRQWKLFKKLLFSFSLARTIRRHTGCSTQRPNRKIFPLPILTVLKRKTKSNAVCVREYTYPIKPNANRQAAGE